MKTFSVSCNHENDRNVGWWRVGNLTITGICEKYLIPTEGRWKGCSARFASLMRETICFV